MSMPEIITLCRSTRFKETFLEISKKLTLNDKIILMHGFFGHADSEKPSEEVKKKLDALHFRKIDLSSSIYVNGYIGDSTKNEIEYAKKTGKNIYYCSKEFGGFTK